MISEIVNMNPYSFQFEYSSTYFNLRTYENFVLRHYEAMTTKTPPPRKFQQIDRDAFRQRIIYVREKIGFSKTDFAASIGISKSNYSQVESGKRMLTVDQIYNAFVVHGVPMEYLIAGQEANLPERLRA